jgi:hypothetical protein
MMSGEEIARLETDAPITALIAPQPNLIIAGDRTGRLHWLKVWD